jgi:hypothetical protein
MFATTETGFSQAAIYEVWLAAHQSGVKQHQVRGMAL